MSLSDNQSDVMIQPFMLNKAALEVLKVATKNYGATQVKRRTRGDDEGGGRGWRTDCYSD